jgi:hypothetical protein
VLSTPPAFVLSQDQTLQQKLAQQTRRPRRGPSRQEKQTGIKPIHDKARHTVEFSRDTRTPSSAARRPSGAYPHHTPPDPGRSGGPCEGGGRRALLTGAAKAFVLSGVPLTTRKLRERFTGRQTDPPITHLTRRNATAGCTHRHHEGAREWAAGTCAKGPGIPRVPGGLHCDCCLASIPGHLRSMEAVRR